MWPTKHCKVSIFTTQSRNEEFHFGDSFKLKINLNLGVVSFCCRSPSLMVEPWQLYLRFLLMAASRMANNMFKLNTDLSLGMVSHVSDQRRSPKVSPPQSVLILFRLFRCLVPALCSFYLTSYRKSAFQFECFKIPQILRKILFLNK